MTKLHKAFVILLASMLLLFIAGGGVVAFAQETGEDIEITETIPAEEGITINKVANQFINYLKEKYGDEYEHYYNVIIEKWGSIEGYLLAFGNNLPEQYKTGWDKFVGWLIKYAPIWITTLVVIAIIVTVVIFKIKFKKIKNWFTALVEKHINKRLAPIENELNLQSKATVAIIHSQKALLGSSEKFADKVKELDEAGKELSDG